MDRMLRPGRCAYIHVFSGFSLHVPSNMTVALVGESGSGKSTVIILLERFYDPQAGEVLIDGINLKKLQLGWIREKIGLVSQEPILLTTTIMENIAYGKVGATLEEIRTVTEITNAIRTCNPNSLAAILLPMTAMAVDNLA
ncbi:ABC transporter B family member 12-like [Magnolia sinica]|uniref:ABC transporter B family member 12-like n=1 Tax=Magnolia sinica TaxID=86752 RepID=UPI002659F694|nr:ABC transporter B family member 12-like [Magnolia sinica]